MRVVSQVSYFHLAWAVVAAALLLLLALEVEEAAGAAVRSWSMCAHTLGDLAVC